MRNAYAVCLLFSCTVCSVWGDQIDANQTAPIKTRELNLPAVPYDYSSEDWPAHVRRAAARFDNTPADNPITDAGATLGRVLFYDPKLSANQTVSCSTCHQQQFAFTDPAKLSRGLNGETVDRNSMSLVNLRFYQRGRFFWDERAKTLEEQVLMPIENPLEMGHRIDQLLPILNADPIYPPLVQAAFGETVLTEQRLARALAQFIRSLVSFDSRFDAGIAKADSLADDFPNFTSQENLGKRMFLTRGRCASCHLSNALPFNPHRSGEPYDSSKRPRRQVAFFFMTRPAVNGIDSIDDAEVDQGVGRVNGAEMSMGQFKSPSLRNLEVTGPYMHDGRFHTIDQVVEHYNWSVRPHPNLDGRLRAFASNGMALPEVEKVALTAFLKTLTDHAFLNDPKFSDPFAGSHPDE